MNSLSLFFYCVFSILLYNNRNCMCEVCEEFFSAQRSGETVTQPKEVGKCFSAQRRKIRTYCPERSALSLLLRHWERQFKKFHRIGPWAPINLCAPLLPRLQLLREDIQLKAAFFLNSNCQPVLSCKLLFWRPKSKVGPRNIILVNPLTISVVPIIITTN